MTFEEWFSQNYQDIPGAPAEAKPVMRQAARAAFASCWNTAIEAAKEFVPIVLEPRLRRLKV